MDKLELYQDIARQLEDDGYDAEVNEEYSGRGMYGRTVPAISGDFSPGSLAKAALRVCGYFDYDPCEVADLLPTGQDSMGLGIVVY